MLNRRYLDQASVTRKLIDAGNYREAEPKVRAMLADAETRVGKESPEVAVALEQLMEALTMPGGTMTIETRAIAARAISLREKLSGPESRDVADTLSLAANLYWSRREPAPSLPFAQRAVAIYESLNGGVNFDHDFANILQALASAQRENDDFKAAKASFERALALYEKSGASETGEAGTCLNNIASMQSNLGDFAGARISYYKALAIEEKTLGPEHPYVAFTLNNIGGLLSRDGKYAEAVAPLTRSVQLTEKLFGPDAPRTATAIVQLANALAHTGQYSEALPKYERAREIYLHSVGEMSVTYAGFMASYAASLAVAGKTRGKASMPPSAPKPSFANITRPPCEDFPSARPCCMPLPARTPIAPTA